MPIMHFSHNDASERIDALREAGETVNVLNADDTGIWVDVVALSARKSKAGEVETR